MTKVAAANTLPTPLPEAVSSSSSQLESSSSLKGIFANCVPLSLNETVLDNKADLSKETHDKWVEQIKAIGNKLEDAIKLITKETPKSEINDYLVGVEAVVLGVKINDETQDIPGVLDHIKGRIQEINLNLFRGCLEISWLNATYSGNKGAGRYEYGTQRRLEEIKEFLTAARRTEFAEKKTEKSIQEMKLYLSPERRAEIFDNKKNNQLVIKKEESLLVYKALIEECAKLKECISTTRQYLDEIGRNKELTHENSSSLVEFLKTEETQKLLMANANRTFNWLHQRQVELNGIFKALQRACNERFIDLNNDLEVIGSQIDPKSLDEKSKLELYNRETKVRFQEIRSAMEKLQEKYHCEVDPQKVPGRRSAVITDIFTFQQKIVAHKEAGRLNAAWDYTLYPADKQRLAEEREVQYLHEDLQYLSLEKENVDIQSKLKHRILHLNSELSSNWLRRNEILDQAARIEKMVNTLRESGKEQGSSSYLGGIPSLVSSFMGGIISWVSQYAWSYPAEKPVVTDKEILDETNDSVDLSQQARMVSGNQEESSSSSATHDAVPAAPSALINEGDDNKS